ncbi:unannotated protein [freshwater metagenome]|uniref:Unannotated protein n=1 Tax=freshwater metagenome TaxID=449393 RepID=A0A6J6BAM6_9ZZZZ
MRRRATASRPETSCPSINTDPEVGVTILLTIRMAVVFPEPESPINTVIFAVGADNEKSASAAVFPYFFETRSNSITWERRS